MARQAKVLVADDEVIFRSVLTGRLIDEGFRVLGISSQEELEAEAPDHDALVVDARLPSENLEGLEVVASLLDSGRIDPGTPIIFISVHAESDDLIRNKLRQLQVLSGRYRWLHKPFETDLLVKLLREAYPQRR